MEHDVRDIMKRQEDRILIIDDDESIRTTLKMILEDNYFVVDTAGMGKLGMEKVEKQFYNVILLDYNLPDTTGIDLAHKINIISEDSKMIMLTGEASLENTIAALREDVFDFLCKPVDQKYLLTRIRKALEQQDMMFRNRLLLLGMQEINFKLEKLNSMKSYFISLFSYELKSPLFSLKRFINSTCEEREENLTATQKHNLRQANNLIEDITALVNNLLEIDKIEEGKIKMEFEEVDINNFILVPLLERRSVSIRERKIEVVMSLSKPLPPLNLSPPKITQAFSILIDNALKLTPKGGKISVLARLVKPSENAQNECDEVEVRIENTGLGIPPELLDKIFDKFFLLNKSSHTRNLEIGLDLALCKNIIELHKGRIWAESEGGEEGNSFIIRLPA